MTTNERVQDHDDGSRLSPELDEYLRPFVVALLKIYVIELDGLRRARRAYLTATQRVDDGYAVDYLDPDMLGEVAARQKRHHGPRL